MISADARSRLTVRILARMPLPPSWVSAWHRMSPRERWLALVASVIVILSVAWALIWQPVQDDTQRARRELLLARAALATARAQTDELAGLQRAAANPASADPRVAVERVLGERGVKASLTSLEAKDNRIHLTFTAVGFDALVGVLDALAKSDGLRAVEATLTSRVDPGTVRAEVTLAR
jgi:general secretion pathway protein M